MTPEDKDGVADVFRHFFLPLALCIGVPAAFVGLLAWLLGGTP